MLTLDPKHKSLFPECWSAQAQRFGYWYVALFVLLSTVDKPVVQLVWISEAMLLVADVNLKQFGKKDVLIWFFG